MMSDQRTIHWIWRGIGFSLPCDWEMLQFSTDFNRGRCGFADRYQFRAELSWSIVKGEPDYERMVSNYMTRMVQDKRLSDPQPLRRSGWHGFSGMLDRGHTSRFGRYLPETGCLVEWALIWPEDRDGDIEAEVLKSCRAEPVQDGAQHWRAFGLDMRPPAAGALEGCEAKPANVEFSFTDTRTRNSWHFRRSGMVENWLQTDLETWMRKVFARQGRDLRFTTRRRDGIDRMSADGRFKPDGIHIKKGRLEAAAWIDPADRRLYLVQKKIRKDDEAAAMPLDRLLRSAPEFTAVPEVTP